MAIIFNSDKRLTLNHIKDTVIRGCKIYKRSEKKKN